MHPTFRNQIRRFRPSAVILAVYWLGIFVATHVPMSPGSGPPAVDDKTAHRVAYFGLSLLICLALRYRRSWVVVATVAVSGSLYAAFDEWSQSFVPGRQPDFRDWVADLTGILAGLALYAAWLLIQNFRRTQ